MILSQILTSLQIIILQELERLTEISQKKLDFKDIKFPVKIRDIDKIEKRTQLALLFLVMKIRKNIQSLCQETLLKDMFIYC